MSHVINKLCITVDIPKIQIKASEISLQNCCSLTLKYIK